MILYTHKQATISDELFAEYKEKIRRVGAYPNVFKDYPKHAIKLIDPRVIKLDAIVRDDFFNQLARTGVNKKKNAIWKDIDKNGFSFGEVPPIVLYVVETDTYYLLDGVTRVGKLDEDFVEECIFEVFEIQNEPSEAKLNDIRVSLGLIYNLYKKQSGDATLEDVKVGMITKTEGHFSTLGQPYDEDQISTYVTAEMQEIDVNGVFTDAQIAQVVDYVVKDKIGDDNGVRHFPSGASKSKIWELMGIDPDGRHTKWILAAATSEMKIFNMVAELDFNKIGWEDVDTVNILLYCGTVGGSTAKEKRKDWEHQLSTAFEKFMRVKKGFMNNTGRVVNAKKRGALPTIHLHSALPAVWAYDELYPMNKPVKFKGNKYLNPDNLDTEI